MLQNIAYINTFDSKNFFAFFSDLYAKPATVLVSPRLVNEARK